MSGAWEKYKISIQQRRIDELNIIFTQIEELITSPIERIAFYELFKWRSDYSLESIIALDLQKKFGGYRVDIYLCYINREVKVELIVECDGHEFHEKTKAQASRDKKRDRFFAKKGIITLRYTGSELVRSPSIVVADVHAILIRNDPINYNVLME